MRWFFLLNLVLMLVLLAGCASEMLPVPAETSPIMNPLLSPAKALDSFPQIADRAADVPEDYEAVAENDILRLYIRKASSAIIVEDKRNGSLWRSSPSGLQTSKGTTSVWKRQIEVPFAVAYVDAERSQPKNVKLDKIEFGYQPVENGVQASYKFLDLNLALAVQYTINQDCLEATIPSEALSETGANGLVSMDVLPYFGAVEDGQEGYIVYPDGSGALLRYATPHQPEVQKITSVIYGTDASGGITGSSNFREDVVMPVFGLTRKEGAFVGMIVEGDFDATLSVARAGKGIAYNHVWSTLLFRRQGRFSITGGQPAWLYQPDLIYGDRRVRYCLLGPEEASYVGMAKRYRTFLTDERGAQRITDKMKDKQPPVMHLAFFMGTERKNWFLSDMITMTTFDDARQILKDLADQGVKRLDVTLYSWNKGGTSQKYPARLPADERLGGAKALRELSDAAHGLGQRVYLQDNYLFSAPNAPGVTPFLDAVRGVDGLPMGSADEGYMLNPQLSLRNYAARDFPVMKTYGVDGLHMDLFGILALPDKNQRYPLTREGFAATWMQIADLSRKTFGSVTTEGSNIYTLPYVDRLDFVTTDSTHYDMFDENIPFYQVVVHGLVQYSTMPYNLISDGQRMFLRQVEYGNMPFFLVTKNSSAELMRTEANQVYSSQYAFWKDEIVRQYQAIEPLSALVGQFITGHEKLAENVYQTTYEDGTRIIVNYNLTAVTAGTVSVPAQDFVIVRGD